VLDPSPDFSKTVQEKLSGRYVPILDEIDEMEEIDADIHGDTSENIS